MKPTLRQDRRVFGLRHNKIKRKAVINMLSQLPVDIHKSKKENLDMEILRAGMIGELDAVNFYEQMADLTENKDIKKVLHDIITEEKTHIGEFQALLLMYDKIQDKELKKGKKEVDDLVA